MATYNCDNMVTILIPGNSAFLSVVRQAVASAASVAGFDSTAALQLQMAMDEICANVIEHGESAVEPANMKVIIEVHPEKMVMRLHDRCRRFSPLEHQLQPLEQYLNSRRHKGLGLIIVRKFMDEIRHSYRADRGNYLTLTKYRKTVGRS